MSAIRIVVEWGAPGEPYNVADRRVSTMVNIVELIAEVLDTSVTIISASEQELAQVEPIRTTSFSITTYAHGIPTYSTPENSRRWWRHSPSLSVIFVLTGRTTFTTAILGLSLT